MSIVSMKERTKFVAPIMEIMGVLTDSNDSFYIKGEHFGYVINRIAKKYLGDPNYQGQSFNSTFFNESKKKSLSGAADSIAVAINRADPLSTAGELYYVIKAIHLGILRDVKIFEAIGLGQKAYLTGIVERIMSSIESPNTGSKSDMAMMFRRHLIVRGVLNKAFSELAPEIDRIWDGRGQLYHGEEGD